VKGFLFGTLEARRNAELEKFRECMHCDDSECFRERVERREDCEKTDLDGAASLEDDLVSLWRRDNRVNRRMACPRDGIANDILLETQLQLQILKTLEQRGVSNLFGERNMLFSINHSWHPQPSAQPSPLSRTWWKSESATLHSIENHRRELRSTIRVVFDYSLRVTLSLL
jgi:hypothetical protein